MTTSKINIKLGPIEVGYEGSESFLKDELPALLKAVSELYQTSKNSLAAEESQEAQPKDAAPKNGKLQATTGSIAAKLGVKSGPDLILAAAARLTLVQGNETFSRQRLIEEMKTASAYHKASYVKNLSAYLNVLVKDGKLNEPTQGNYALTASTLKDLEPRIV